MWTDEKVFSNIKPNTKKLLSFGFVPSKEGFCYYLFTGVFEAATIHYAVAKKTRFLQISI